jgi:UDP-glucose 4-epimerase
MRVLVTGGAGFIGSCIVDRLVERGDDVAVLDNFSTGRLERVHPAATVLRCDLRSPELGCVVGGARPDVVVHAAAQASVTHSVAAPLEDGDVNVLGTVRLLAGCADAGVRTVVYISTGGAAYGDTEILPTPEDHPLLPTSPYGVSKVSAELYVRCLGSLHGLRTVTLRLANVFGPRQDPAGEAGVVAIFTSRLLRGERCLIYGDGRQTRDFVYVGDVADAVVRAIERPEAVGAMNIATGTETTIVDLHQRLARIVGADVLPVHAPARPGEQRRSVLSAARASRAIGWQASTPLDLGLTRTVEYFVHRSPSVEPAPLPERAHS